MSRALITNVESCRESMDQPTMRQLYASSTAAQNSFPSLVGCSVMSVTHSSLGCSRWNLRLTRSSAATTPRSRLTRAPLLDSWVRVSIGTAARSPNSAVKPPKPATAESSASPNAATDATSRVSTGVLRRC
jgi:hypothetical protein